MTTSSLLGRQGELLPQLRDLLILPSSSSLPASKQLVSAVGPLAGAVGPGPPPPSAAVPSTAMASGRRRRRRESCKRGRGDEVTTNGEDPVAAAAAAPRPRRHYCKRSTRKQVQRSGTSMVVTSAPDLFDGYQWRKYGQKLIEGAMYPRSYYRCARSAEQGCAAKRTVQRNDDADDGRAAAATAPMYTVVRVGEHTCTANDDSPDQAPVILETTAVVVPGATSNSSTAPASSSPAAASCSTTTGTAGTESPAIVSDNTLNNSSIIASSEYHCYAAADDCHGLLAAAVHDDNDWVPGLAASSPPPSFPGIEDFAGPIRSPVHVSAEDGWMFDQFLQLQFVNDDPAMCQHV